MNKIRQVRQKGNALMNVVAAIAIMSIIGIFAIQEGEDALASSSVPQVLQELSKLSLAVKSYERVNGNNTGLTGRKLQEDGYIRGYTLSTNDLISRTFSKPIVLAPASGNPAQATIAITTDNAAQCKELETKILGLPGFTGASCASVILTVTID